MNTNKTAPASSGATMAYARCAAQDENGEELRRRIAETLSLAAAHGLDVESKNVIAEYGSGAGLTGRPGLASLLDQVEKGQVGTLVVTNLDRLGRNRKTVNSIMDALTIGGVTVVTADQEFYLGRAKGTA